MGWCNSCISLNSLDQECSTTVPSPCVHDRTFFLSFFFQAAQLGTKQIDEDGLLELLRTRPGKKSGGGASTRTKKSSSKKSTLSVSSPSVRSKGVPKENKVKSKSPPHSRNSDATAGQGNVVTTPTTHHVTTPVAMTTPSASTSSAAGTPSVHVATPKMEGDLFIYIHVFMCKRSK